MVAPDVATLKGYHESQGLGCSPIPFAGWWQQSPLRL